MRTTLSSDGFRILFSISLEARATVSDARVVVQASPFRLTIRKLRRKSVSCLFLSDLKMTSVVAQFLFSSNAIHVPPSYPCLFMVCAYYLIVVMTQAAQSNSCERLYSIVVKEEIQNRFATREC